MKWMIFPVFTTIHTACVPWRQLEIELDGLAELDDFWSRIPAVGHKAWSERASHVIVDASPRWDVLRSVPLLSPEAAASAAAPGRSLPQQQASSSQDSSGSSSGLDVNSGLQIPLEEGQAEALLAEQVRFLQQYFLLIEVSCVHYCSYACRGNEPCGDVVY